MQNSFFQLTVHIEAKILRSFFTATIFLVISNSAFAMHQPFIGMTRSQLEELYPALESTTAGGFVVLKGPEKIV